MFPLIAMLIFILIALLGLFHVLIVKATAWGFVAWFVALVVYNMTRKEGAESKEKSRGDRVVPSGLGSDVPILNSGTMIDNTIVFGDYNDGKLSLPPQGGDATIPVISRPETRGGGQSNSALLRLMSWTERELDARSTRAGEAGPSDDRYEEPQASYPMEMKMHD